MYGFDEEQVATGDPAQFWAIVHPDDRAELERVVRGAFAAGDVCETEHRIVRADGEVRWLRTRGDVERDETGTPVRQLGVVVDVTESRRTEQELREKTAHLEEAQEVLGRAQEIGKIGSFVTDLQADRIEWSRELARLFGAGDEAIVSTRALYWTFVHPDDLAITRERIDAALVQGDRAEIEYRVRRPGGDTIWAFVQTSIERDADGTALRLVGVVQDVTERRELEEQVRRA